MDVNEDEKWPPNGYSVKNISRLFYLDSRQAMTHDTTPTFEKLRDYITQRSDNIYNSRNGHTYPEPETR